MSNARKQNTEVLIFLRKSSKSSDVLAEHLAKNINTINKYCYIKFVYINAENAEKVRGMGIRQTPTMIQGKHKIEGIEKIIKALTFGNIAKETYGYGVTSPEEMLHKWQSDIVTVGEAEEDGDETDPSVRSQQLRQRMADFQKKRPRMEGVDKKRKIKGGVDIKSKAHQQEYGDFSTRDGDLQFLRDSHVMDTENTPIAGYVESSDGELILEDYFLEEAKSDGKKLRNENLKSGKYNKYGL